MAAAGNFSINGKCHNYYWQYKLKSKLYLKFWPSSKSIGTFPVTTFVLWFVDPSKYVRNNYLHIKRVQTHDTRSLLLYYWRQFITNYGWQWELSGNFSIEIKFIITGQLTGKFPINTTHLLWSAYWKIISQLWTAYREWPRGFWPSSRFPFPSERPFAEQLGSCWGPSWNHCGDVHAKNRKKWIKSWG